MKTIIINKGNYDPLFVIDRLPSLGEIVIAPTMDKWKVIVLKYSDHYQDLAKAEAICTYIEDESDKR